MKFKPVCAECGPLQVWIKLSLAVDHAEEHRRACPAHTVTIINNGKNKLFHTLDWKAWAAGERTLSD